MGLGCSGFFFYHGNTLSHLFQLGRPKAEIKSYNHTHWENADIAVIVLMEPDLLGCIAMITSRNCSIENGISQRRTKTMRLDAFAMCMF